MVSFRPTLLECLRDESFPLVLIVDLASDGRRVYGDGAMSPQAAMEAQIERYRQMTGAERLALALDLHEFACDMAREGIRQQHPGVGESEVERLLRQRLELVTRP